MKNNFKAVYFDIVGYCNAKCPYCHSGINKIVKGGKIDIDKFKSILTELLKKDVVRKGTVISLYNWGEPLLHPEIDKIIDCMNELGLKYALSTNASIVPKIDHKFVKGLDRIIFSMPGFSEESFSRIHGFGFQDAKHNVLKIVKDCRGFGFKGRFVIFYHIYRFNIDEINDCERFANDNGIIFNPHYAFINHWWMLYGFLNKTLSVEKTDRITKDLFNSKDIKEKMKKSPEGYVCPQSDFLIIDEEGDVATCCQIARDHKEYSCGNILKEDIDRIFEKRKNRQVCRECIDSGLAFYLNSSIAPPDFYRRGMKQNFIALKHKFSV
ncbi:radical SAM protein [Candidatus Omnitrophota bacterium]